MRKIGYVMLVFLMACTNKNSNQLKVDAKDTSQVSNDSSKVELLPDSSLLDYSGSVLQSIKELNVEAMAGCIHPTLGIRFSPYTNVDTTSDIHMTAQEFKDQWTKNVAKKINWGSYASGEEQIKMNVKEYFKRFVYDLDFLELSKPTLNTTQALGTMINNIAEAYPGADFVEYYIPGVDKKYEGMDWRALTLVFRKNEATYYLVAIVHSEWTT